MFRFDFHSYLQVLLVVGASLVAHTLASGCTINLSTDIPKFEPVILTRTGSSAQYALLKPTGQITTLPVGAQLLLECQGRGNVIESLGESSLELHCNADNSLRSASNVKHQLSQLGCKSIPASVLKLTTQPCADNRGLIYESGFVHSGNKFAPVFQICYDKVAENTFYTHNILNGAAMKYGVHESTRRPFRADGMKSSTTATNNFYRTKNQEARFMKFFGAKQPYISKLSFLSRGHLTPDADFIFSYEQLATYFYVNVAPEFQIVNAGNWLRVENLARSLSSDFGDDLESYNGYMGLLQLPNPSSNKLIPIYIDNREQIEAPQYYFKVLKHAATDSAIVLISLNNPFATAADVSKAEFCTNVCQEAGLDQSYFADATRGYTFCCALKDFQKHYADLPSTLSATRLLSNPNISKPNIRAPARARRG